MQECRDALWAADEAAGWHDNVTVVLAQIISGGVIATDSSATSHPMSSSKAELIRKNKLLKQILGTIIALVVLCVAGFLCWRHVGVIVGNYDNKTGDTTANEQPLVSSDFQQPEEPKQSPSTKKDDIKKESQPKQSAASATKEDPLHCSIFLCICNETAPSSARGASVFPPLSFRRPAGFRKGGGTTCP